jgi:hypothetical protein
VAVVLADLGVLDLLAGDAVQQAAGLFGALGRVLRQVARAVPALLVIGAELLDVEPLAPPDRADTELLDTLTLTFSTAALSACSSSSP